MPDFGQTTRDRPLTPEVTCASAIDRGWPEPPMPGRDRVSGRRKNQLARDRVLPLVGGPARGWLLGGPLDRTDGRFYVATGLGRTPLAKQRQNWRETMQAVNRVASTERA